MEERQLAIMDEKKNKWNLFGNIWVVVATCAIFLTGCGGENQMSRVSRYDSERIQSVLNVVAHGLTQEEAKRLAERLGIRSREGLLDKNGVMTFVDQKKYRYIPVKYLGIGRGDEDKLPVTYEALDFEAIKKIRTLPKRKAAYLFTKALKDTKLFPDGILETSVNVANSRFEAFNKRGQIIVENNIDTHVKLNNWFKEFSIVGAGSNINVSYDSNAEVTQLRYAFRKLEPGKEVGIISEDEARDRCIKQNSDNDDLEEHLDVTTHLVYYAPSGKNRAKVLLPHYECNIIKFSEDNKVNLLKNLIPATEDPTYVPKIHLDAYAKENRVTAWVEIRGGAGKYKIAWSSSSTYLNSSAAKVEYYIKPRKELKTEKITVKVTDSNGITVFARKQLPIKVIELLKEDEIYVGGVTDYGTENAVTNQFGDLEGGFVNEMNIAGVTKRFSWTGMNAWEQDFKATGDSNYIDNTDITFYAGHGYGGGFTFENSSHNDGTLDYNDADDDWGDKDLEWLALLSCQVMIDSWSGMSRFDRWKQEFDGLHLLLGFHTSAYAWHSFSGEFANNMVRVPFLWWNKPMKIRDAWFDATDDEQPNGVVPVVMGVFRHDGVSNINDYFWGKGSVGPDIRDSNIAGYWTLTGP